ncbi:MAG: CCA tRNA nucleotidyltransferase [Candidatus Methanomethylicaceae archaeon]
MKEILEEVLKRVKPKDEDFIKIEKIFEKIKNRIIQKAEELGINVKVEIEGSIAKGTWLSNDKDIDIFIVFPLGTKIEFAKEIGLELAKYGVEENWKLGYAEHPYIEAKVNDYKIEIVPSIEMREGERPLTAVDRTPLHTIFIKNKMNKEMKDEVRLLKQFMKGIGVYGAELKIGGFSGYLCELLILYYGSFEETIKNAAKWKPKTVIDYMKYYSNEELCKKIFDSPLIVIDPIDMRRNVAAAVTLQSYSTFIAASKYFLKKPNIDFFFPKEFEVKSEDIFNELKKRGTNIAIIKINCPKIPPDILWGEINRTLNKCVKLLESYDFQVLDYKAWSDEENNIFLIMELERDKLRNGKIHYGPKIWWDEEKFLNKHLEKALAGPYIKNERWYVEVKRKYTTVRDLLINEFGKLQLSKDIMNEVKKGFSVYINEEIGKELNPEFAKDLLKFLKKRPLWLN